MGQGNKLWTEAEENVGINEKNRQREISGTEQIKQTDRNKMARKICVGTESTFQMAITAEEIIEQMNFGKTVASLRTIDGKEWLKGVKWGRWESLTWLILYIVLNHLVQNE